MTPFTGLLRMRGPSLHCGGPHWPDFDQQTHARHCRDGAPVDDQPAPAREEVTLDGRFAWGGAIVNHFGHQIADFGMRLGPTMATWPEAVFLYSGLEVRPGVLERLPPFFNAVLDWLGIPPERVRLVDRPTRVRELVVVPQAEQLLGPGPSAAHLDWLDDLTARRLGRIQRDGVVYVSRAAMRTRFAGESYVEEVLTRSGVQVVRPEMLPLSEQLRVYASARHLVFAEGSAIHGVQLLGRALGEVTVLRRRTDSPGAVSTLERRAQSLHYVVAIRGKVYPVHPLGMPHTWIGMTVLDDGLLLDELEALGIRLKLHWKPSDYATRRDGDVGQWLQERRESGVDSKIPGSPEMIERTLRAAGLGHLADRS